MVYVVDAQYAASNENAVTRRNTLFTAITRSRAWVRVVGYGPNMNVISHEINTVQTNGYRLEFDIPSAGELDRMRHLNRDLSGDARAKVQQATAGLKKFLEAFEADEVELDDLSPELRTRLMRRLREELEGDDA
jgi:superfamily I DNA and RNA helicase